MLRWLNLVTYRSHALEVEYAKKHVRILAPCRSSRLKPVHQRSVAVRLATPASCSGLCDGDCLRAFRPHCAEVEDKVRAKS